MSNCKISNKPILLLIVIVTSFYVSYAQSLSGRWVGNSNKTILIPNATKIEVELELYNDSLITGVSHLYYKHGDYEHHKLSGIYNRSDSSVIFTEDSVLSYRFRPEHVMCQGIYIMKLVQTDSSLRLEGKWKHKSGGGLFKCPTLFTWLVKEGDNRNIDQVPGLEDTEPAIPDIQHVIEVTDSERDSIKIELYDNGMIDGDSISLYFNDEKIIANALLSDVPIITFINLKKGVNLQKLKMVAENLGTIPPNTSLMIITTRSAIYKVHMKSDFSHSGIVEFFLK